MTSIYDCYELNNGVRVPCLGFGTYKAAEDGGGQVLRMALDAGYRYFDTASFYQNEEVMGKVFGEAEIKRGRSACGTPCSEEWFRFQRPLRLSG